MSSHLPKYQFAAINARRSGKGIVTFKYQQLLKSGKWGAIREGNNQYHGNKNPQEILDYWESINPGKKFRLVEA